MTSEVPGFGYIMPLRAPRYKGIVDLMKRRIEPSVRALTTAGLAVGDWIYIPGIRRAVRDGAEGIAAFLIRGGARAPLNLKMEGLSPEDREILLAGCLINHYARR